MAKAIGFRGRGEKRSIGTPFDAQVGGLPAVRRLHLRLPGLPAPLHLHRAGQGDLRRLREPAARRAWRRSSSTT